MIKRGLTKCLSLILALTVIFSNFFSLGAVTAYAAVGEKADIYMVQFPRGNDANRSGWGHGALQYMNGWNTGGASNTMALRAIGSYTGKICYCIEPGTGQHTGDTLTQKDENFWNNFPPEYNRTIDGDQIKIFIGRILQYGYTGNLSTEWKTQDAAGADKLSFAIATQLLIWETIVGERDENFSLVDTGNCDRVLDSIRENNPIRSQILNHYSDIEKAVQNHTKVPSFCARSAGKAKTIEMQWDGNQYVSVLTDSNYALSNYSFHSNVPSVSFTVNGNELTVTSKTAPKEEITVTAEKNSSQRKGLITWTDGIYLPGKGSQDTVTYAQSVNDPVKAYVKIKVSYGSAKIVKTSEDGKVDGISFRVQGNGIDKTIQIENGGQIQIDNLIPGVYTVTELTEEKYVPQDVQHITVISGQITTVNFSNTLKKWQLSVTKRDKETGNPQGDASLSGAKYGIYKGEQLIDSYTTDENGQFTTKYYVCDSDWTLREITPSEGYLLNTESLHIGAEAKLYTAEYNLASPLDALETVQKGKIAVIKHCDNGSTQIETPETGAEFEIFLKSSGGYEASKESERDILICDENGFAQSKDLPYGIYTVKQTKGWDGKEIMKPFDVFISKNGETYRYLINNAVFKSLIEIVKKDAETGKIIPASGIGFKVRNTDTGEYIVQHINYPTPADIDIYYTDITGKLMLPEALPYGNYEIIEQNTCYGYVLDSTPVPFKVDGSKTVITVEKRNMPQKGIITVSKSGEVFSSVFEVGGLYQPVYSPKGLAGAVYEITAAEDVYTLDGTLRYAKGTVVSKITTDKNGTAVTEPLYLGKYEIREIKAPYGMIVNDEIHTVELTYAGQEISITEMSAEFCNERQNAEISLSKVLEQNETFGIGNNGEILSVQFGLFANEDLKAADSSVIPKDSLIEIVNCDENGKAAFNTDIPVGAKLYVKEISADSHYLLSDEKYPVIFEYAGQNVATVNLSVNNGELIENDLICGTVKGLKIDRETDETIAGALFGLFKADETEFTEKTAILLAKSNENGIFTFENIPFGEWTIKELQPAENYLPSDNIHRITVTENEQIIEITAVNDRIPEIKTTATVDGEKEICATEVFTLTDTVSYKHLIPGKEYVLKGILIDKSTGKPLVINGKKIHSEASFTSENPSGEVTVKFTFDSKFIKQDTDIVIFENLYRDGKELAVHANIEDEGQTVKVKVPKIGTKATVNGKKSITAKGTITVEDTVSYTNLTPGKEYTVKGVLMDKTTGKPFTVNGEEIRSLYTFKPETADGEIKMTFTFDASGIVKSTEIVVFESVFRDGVEIAVHADITDEGQTVKLIPLMPENPQTGDDSNLGFWFGLGAVALGGLVSAGVMAIKHKKDDEDA